MPIRTAENTSDFWLLKYSDISIAFWFYSQFVWVFDHLIGIYKCYFLIQFLYNYLKIKQIKFLVNDLYNFCIILENLPVLKITR